MANGLQTLRICLLWQCNNGNNYFIKFVSINGDDKNADNNDKKIVSIMCHNFGILDNLDEVPSEASVRLVKQDTIDKKL